MGERKRKQRSLSIGRMVMMAIVVVLLIGIGVVVKNIVSLSIEKRQLQQQNAELTDKRDELTAELQNVNDPDYIEEQARKLLHMIKPGEVLYILNGSGHPKPESDGTELELPTRPDAPTYDETQDESTEETGGEAEEVTEEPDYSSEEESTDYTEETYEETESSEESYESEETSDESSDG